MDPPISQIHWPNPPRKPYLITTIASRPIGDADIAFNQLNWPIPSPRKPYLLTELNSSVNLTPSTKPFNNLEYPTPRRKPYIITDVCTTFLVSSDRPFKQDNYPNPLLKRRLPNTWINIPKPVEPSTNFMPCSVLEWDNPAPKRRMALTHIGQIAQLQQVFTTPTSRLPVYPNRLDAKKTALSWLQGRPFYYTEPSVNPFGNIEWKIPQIKKTTLIINYIQKFNDVGLLVNPFSQKDWPNPVRKKGIPIQWLEWYQQDNNLPFVANVTNNPVLRVQRLPLTWITNALIPLHADVIPVLFVDFPNPILVKRQNVGTFVNLLQNTLTPPAVAPPFYQTDYPNPQRGKRNFHIGIIQNKPTYYTEQPLQPNQYNWPVFRSPKRNPTGFIQFIIPTEPEPPKIFNILAVPLRKRIPTESWTYSSLFNLTSIVGITPFNQYDWPNPRRVRINRAVLDFINQTNIILPNVAGRIICISSNITEYDIESALENYDIESSFTEYDIESGGSDCE